MREVELSLNGTLREIFSFGESRAAFDRFLPSMCVMAEAQCYRPFGHKVDDFDIALDGTTWVPDSPVDAKLADTLERCAAQSFDPEHYKTASEEMQSMMNSPPPDSANTSLPITSGCPSRLWTANQRFAGSIARK